jgi:hypothetical protein
MLMSRFACTLVRCGAADTCTTAQGMKLQISLEGAIQPCHPAKPSESTLEDSMRTGLVCISAALLAASGTAAFAQQAAAPWFVNMKLVSGPSTCTANYTRGVREQGNVFNFLDADGKAAIWTVSTAGDGSVAPVETKGGTQRLRVTVPAGKGPRAFDVLNLGNGCAWKAEPK